MSISFTQSGRQLAKIRRAQRLQKLKAKRGMRFESFKQQFKYASEQPPTDDQQVLLNTQEIADKDVTKLAVDENQQQKQEQKHIDHLEGVALDKIAEIQKEITNAQKTDPTKSKQEQVYEEVKRQIEAKKQEQQLTPSTQQQGIDISNYLANKQQQEFPMQNFRDLSLPFSRRNYEALKNEIISRMTDLTQEQKNKLKQRYRYRLKPGVKMQSLDDLKIRLNALYGKYISWLEGHQRVNFILKKIQSQLTFMNKNPTKWYNWYLRKVLKLQQSSDLWETMINPQIRDRQMERRAEALMQKKNKIMKNIHFYYRKYQNSNLLRVKQLTQLMQKKTEVYQEQKKTLTFLIDTKLQQIDVLKKQIETDKSTHQHQLYQIDQQLKLERDKEERLQKELVALKGQKDIEQKVLKAKMQEVNLQKKVIETKSQENEKQKQKITKLHQQNMKLKAQLLASHEKAHQDLLTQQVNSHNKHVQQMQQLQQYLQDQLAGQKLFAQRKHQQLMNQQYQNMYQTQHDLAVRLQGKEAEFSQWQKNAQAQFDKQREQYQSKLAQLRKQTDFSKEKQGELLKSIQSIKNKAKSDQETFKRLMQNKVSDLASKLSQAVETTAKQKKDYENKIANLHAKKKQEIDKMLVQIQQLKKQKKRLEEQQAKLKAQLSELSQIVSKYAQAKDMQTSVLSWYDKSSLTIRQCFREKNTEKWIASTRGVNVPRNQISALNQMLVYWMKIYKAGKQSFPRNKQVMRLRTTEIMSILDTYKEVNYFGLREAYWKDGQMLPTRRGINVSWDQLPQFLNGISSQIKIQQLKNPS